MEKEIDTTYFIKQANEFLNLYQELKMKMPSELMFDFHLSHPERYIPQELRQTSKAKKIIAVAQKAITELNDKNIPTGFIRIENGKVSFDSGSYKASLRANH